MYDLLLHVVQAFESEGIQVVAAEQLAAGGLQQLIVRFIDIINQAPGFAFFPGNVLRLHPTNLLQDDLGFFARWRNDYRQMIFFHDASICRADLFRCNTNNRINPMVNHTPSAMMELRILPVRLSR